MQLETFFHTLIFHFERSGGLHIYRSPYLRICFCTNICTNICRFPYLHISFQPIFTDFQIFIFVLQHIGNIFAYMQHISYLPIKLPITVQFCNLSAFNQIKSPITGPMSHLSAFNHSNGKCADRQKV